MKCLTRNSTQYDGEKTELRANLGSGTSGRGKLKLGVRIKAARNGTPHAQIGSIHSRPEQRKRVTGSATGTGCRRKIQRATANPNAA